MRAQTTDRKTAYLWLSVGYAQQLWLLIEMTDAGSDLDDVLEF